MWIHARRNTKHSDEWSNINLYINRKNLSFLSLQAKCHTFGGESSVERAQATFPKFAFLTSTLWPVFLSFLGQQVASCCSWRKRCERSFGHFFGHTLLTGALWPSSFECSKPTGKSRTIPQRGDVFSRFFRVSLTSGHALAIYSLFP